MEGPSTRHISHVTNIIIIIINYYVPSIFQLKTTMILSHTKRIEGLAKCINQIGTALTFMSIVALCTDALVATPSAIHHPHQQLIHSRSLTTLGNAQLDDSSRFEDVFADEASAAILSGQDLDIITLRGGDAPKSSLLILLSARSSLDYHSEWPQIQIFSSSQYSKLFLRLLHNTWQK